MKKVYVPHAMQIVHNNHTYSLSSGWQSIPDELEGHWWLDANGVPVIRPT